MDGRAHQWLTAAQIVTLTYPMLLHKDMRESAKLSVKGHVVVIDEAHNLMDTIADLHSATVSLRQLTSTRRVLGLYMRRFQARLKGKNRTYLVQLARLLDSLAAYLQSEDELGEQGDAVVTIGDLMARKGADQINLHKLLHYLNESKVARKLEGFAEQRKDHQAGEFEGIESGQTSLMGIQSFLFALTHPSTEGRLFGVRSDDGDRCLKYTLLDATHHFKEIVTEAKAVVLAGGTMSPVSTSKRCEIDGLTAHRWAITSTISCPTSPQSGSRRCRAATSSRPAICSRVSCPKARVE